MKPLNENSFEILRICGEVKTDAKGIFPGARVREECDRRGIHFHPSIMVNLVRHGFLIRHGSSRGGSRRYYEVVNANPTKRTRLLHSRPQATASSVKSP
jgi:hypothetical protein